MIRIIYFLILAGCIPAQIVQAQFAYFPAKGTIYFEKTDHPKARIRQMMNSQSNNRGGGFWGNIEQMPETRVSQYVMKFDQTQSLMQNVVDKSESTSNTSGRSRNNNRPGGQMRINMGGGGVFSSNEQKVYYQNIKTSQSKVQIELDEVYVLEDSLQEITWRFTDEYRQIAGYDCRRVNGATKDSLYLVAFYTDQIPLGSGPILAHGLPGMILGLAIPEMHINYWATKVEFSNEDVSRNWEDKKAKSLKTNDFADLILRQMRGRGGQDVSRRKFLEQLYY